MREHRFIILALSLLIFPTFSLGQTCDGTLISEVLFADMASTNTILTSSISGNAVQDSEGTKLTSTGGDSYGGFFFDAATDFQGPGGFSVKFVLQSTDTSIGVGDAWEFIIAGSTNTELLPGPYASGNTNAGLSGWSRLNSFVVEFDSLNSGTGEQDESTNHIAVYLAGTEICTTDVSYSFGSGDKYTVWIDYNGFGTIASIRVSAANDGSRPAAATLDCDIDIWATLDITASNHVGFFAYNPSSGGAEHALVDSLSIADAYRPYDSDSCAVYDKCAQRSGDNLCLTQLTSTRCKVDTCDPAYVWDVSGEQCCAFIEKATWIVASSAGSGPFSAGQTVDCEQVRRTIAFLTDSSNCQ